MRGRLPKTVAEPANGDGWRDALAAMDDGDWRRRMLADEIHRLGGNTDRYLDAIASVASRRLRQRHLGAHRAVCRVLMSHDLYEVRGAIGELDTALDRVGWMTRSRLRAEAER